MGELIMRKQHDKQFKEDSVRYYMDHKELEIRGCALHLDIGASTMSKWIRDCKSENGIQVWGSGNYSSDEQKEIARLNRELRNTKDALDVLKKAIGILGK